LPRNHCTSSFISIHFLPSGDDAEDEDDEEDTDYLKQDDADTETEEESGFPGSKDRRAGGKVFKNLMKDGESGCKETGTQGKENFTLGKKHHSLKSRADSRYAIPHHTRY
jgi:hypothetical protein